MRNRWQRIEKGRKLREEGQELKNRCHACGEPKRGHICKARLRGGPQVDVPTPPQLKMPPPPSISLPDAGGPSSSRSPAAMMQPPLKRTRSGSKLVPEDLRPRYTVDVDKANDQALPYPKLSRSHTSFFQELAQSDIFSPSTREMMVAWADSPTDAPAKELVASDVAAPPSLRRVASRDGTEVPKLTRSVTSYFDSIMGDGVPRASSPLVPAGDEMRAPAAGPSSLSRQPSLGLSSLSRQPSSRP